MHWDSLVKLAILAATAPIWWPVVKALYHSVWEAGMEDTGSILDERTERKGPKRDPRVWSDRGETWSQKRLINPQWDTGRKTPRKHGFRKRAS